MAAWRYEISLLVLKNISCIRSLMKYFSTLQEKFCISMWPCNILYTFFQLNTPKDTVISLTLVILDVSILSCTNLPIFKT